MLHVTLYLPQIPQKASAPCLPKIPALLYQSAPRTFAHLVTRPPPISWPTHPPTRPPHPPAECGS